MPNSILKNSFYSVLRNVLTLVFPVITFTYVSRILLADGLGKIEFSKSFINYFALLAMLGINNYGARECAKVREDKRKLSLLVKDILLINIFSVFISYAALIITILFISKLTNYRVLLIIYSLTIVLTVMGIEWLYTAVENFKFIAVRTFIFQVLSLILMFIFVKKYEDLYIYAIIQVIAMSGSNIINFIHSRKYIDYAIKAERKLRTHFKPIFMLFLTVIFTQVYWTIGKVLLGFFTNDRNVGLYSAADKLSSLVAMAIWSLILVLCPRISYYAEKNMMTDIEKITAKAINLILMLGFPATIGFIILSRYVLLLFSGGDFLEADTASKILSAHLILGPLHIFFETGLLVQLRKEKYYIISSLVALIVSIALNLILIPCFGVAGAATAGIAAMFSACILSAFFVSKIIPFKAIFNRIWQYILASLSIIPIYFLFSYYIANIYIMASLVITISISAYFLILILLKNEYLLELKNIIKSVLFRLLNKKH